MIRRPPRSTLFPSRRSSDLARQAALRPAAAGLSVRSDTRHHVHVRTRADRPAISTRSEEHTSELQSQSNLVCRLLLEKKKKKKKNKKPPVKNKNIHLITVTK